MNTRLTTLRKQAGHTLALLCLLGATAGQLRAQLHPFNGNFEDTVIVTKQGVTDTLPRHWASSGFGADLTNDAVAGKYAIYIWNWYYYGKGILVNGNSIQQGKGGQPITYRPSALTGSFKYIPGNVGTTNDSGVVYIHLVKYNATTKRRDTIGSGSKTFGPQSSYTAFQVPIAYASAVQPDTLLVRFVSSTNGFCSASSNGDCLFLYLDELKLVNSATGLARPLELQRAPVYPNPAGNYADITNPLPEPVQASLYAADGRLLRSWTLNAGDTQRLQTEGLQQGVYIIRFGNTGKTYKLVKE